MSDPHLHHFGGTEESVMGIKAKIQVGDLSKNTVANYVNSFGTVIRQKELEELVQVAINTATAQENKDLRAKVEEQESKAKEFKLETDKIKARNLVNHIEAICDVCAHLKGEDGCPNCIAKERDDLRAKVEELERNRDAEIEGIRTLRMEIGAKENEGIRAAVKRICYELQGALLDLLSTKQCYVKSLEKLTEAKQQLLASELARGKMREALIICRNRIAEHDGCSRYQIGDSCIIENTDKIVSTSTQSDVVQVLREAVSFIEGHSHTSGCKKARDYKLECTCGRNDALAKLKNLGI